MTWQSHPALGAGAALLFLISGACSGGPSTPASNQVDIISWWTEDSESEALAKLMSVFHEEYPDQTAISSPETDSMKARERIKTRLLGRQGIDTFQANGGWDLLTWVFYNDHDAAESQLE